MRGRTAPLTLLLVLAACVPLPALSTAGPEGYYWPKRAGTHIGHGAVPYEVPTDWTKPPAWTWDNPDDELFRHGPVIDDKKNIYVATSCGIVRKFSPAGEMLWYWRTAAKEGKIVVSPFLYEGKLYIGSMGWPAGLMSTIHCIDMETGKQLWKVDGCRSCAINLDSSTLHVAEGVLLGAAKHLPARNDAEGNNKIYAHNATDGKPLWDVVLDGVVWNFMPSTPGDGTVFFATSCGVAQRRNLVDGSSIWKSELEEPSGFSCGTGGGSLGPNGVFYAEANYHVGPKSSTGSPMPHVAPCGPFFCPEGFGLLVAYDAQNGTIRWARRIFPGMGGTQYPAVGMIGGHLTLVAGVGTNPNVGQIFMGPKYLPPFVGRLIQKWQLKHEWLRRMLGVQVKRNGVATFDAETGRLIWFWEEEPWSFFGAAGDEDKFHERVLRSMVDPRMEVMCGPDNWGIPAITGDGTVIVSSGSTGNLYALRDANGDGEIEPSEVSTLETKQAFLNGPALAPGLMAVAPCWGRMYVFKS
mmetsp:Transcript_68824/g.204840  ORF Transcript_68824/g.204840 Transcript_68824/m.204840 type:complete len:523 (+) Transcript_68824:60-1628(+)